MNGSGISRLKEGDARGGADQAKGGKAAIETSSHAGGGTPWYRRTLRWAQANLTESDPLRCDVAWWRSYWRQCGIQGVIVNAGGIVAYYPSALKLQYRAEALGERDLFGEFASAARQEGLTVLARMDVNRAARNVYEAHPDWFVVNRAGEPLTADGRYFSCVNTPYYKQLVPEMLIEIITNYKPDGFTDNSWTGVSREHICYCGACETKFRQDAGLALPVRADWDDPAYRWWIRWSYACRMENWDLFNRVTRERGGADCLWLGMVNANPLKNHGSFCDLKAVGERSLLLMCDHQSRDELNGFEQNSLNGRLLHGVAGWNTVIPESMAQYARGVRTFRQGSNPPKEARLWMLGGIAGGLSPWVHHVGAVQEDRRQFGNAPPVLRWHEEHEADLYDRTPLANVGLVWSHENTEFYGRDDAQERVALPWRGFVRALNRARVPFLPVHADHIARDAAGLDVLVLPELAAMSDEQCAAVERFVMDGGSLIVTGASATMNAWGEARSSYPLETILGLRPTGRTEGAAGKPSADWAASDGHNYIRLPEPEASRHPLAAGFEHTDMLPFGGMLRRVELTDDTLRPVATYIPSYPIYPPEFSWMREARTDMPVLLAGEHPSGGRLVYFAGDVDRAYGRSHLPDLGDLLANAVRWAAKDTIPLRLEGPGYLDCALYRKEERLLVHLINLSGVNETPGFVEQYWPVGPLTISVRAAGLELRRARLAVGGTVAPLERSGDWLTVRLPALTDHELIVLE